MVVLEYTPSHPVGPPLGLVGKGIVFDSGGLNLKTSPSYMKGDMVRTTAPCTYPKRDAFI